MKPVFYLLMLFILNPHWTFSQDFENSNWVFGVNNMLGFLPSVSAGTISSGTGFVGFEGCATVSDRSGNLLLFSDGVRLWHRNSLGVTTLVTNQLKGTPSSAQNLIFVPKPKYSNRYYLFYINGETSGLLGGASLTPAKRGLYFTEVSIDCDTASIIGNVANVLKDSDGVLINDGYENFSEAITSSQASDGINYWVVAHIQRIVGLNYVGNIVSYKVTEDSVGTIDHGPNSNTSLSLLAEEATSIGRCTKISQGKFALTSNRSGLFIGDFDIITGLVSITDTIHNSNDVYYGVEFSENAQVVYYTGNNGTNNFIRKVGVPIDLSTLISNSTTTEQTCALQLGIDNKIYASVRDSYILRSISNTNDLLSDPIMNGSKTMINLCQLGLPQKVKRHLCEATLEDNVNVLANNLMQSKRSDWIKATNYINPSARVIYHANNYVELLPDISTCVGDNNGFEAEFGSEFVAYIADCNIDFVYRNSGSSTNANQETERELIRKDKLQIYPNPSNTFVTIALDSEKIKSIVITSIDGKVIQSLNVNSHAEQIDVSSFTNGLYLITVQTDDGRSIINKFIKN